MIQAADRVLVTTHINPDGDAIGSALGLMHVLSAIGKQTTVVNQHGFGKRYGFLPGSAMIVTETEDQFDLGIAVDCGNLNRVGKIKETLMRCPQVLRIDHHTVGESFGNAEFLDFTAAAVGEMIADLAHFLKVPLAEDSATCLLASIVEDTGCFQFSSVSSRTFEFVSRLVDAGADLHDVVQNLFWMHDSGAVRLSGKCLDQMTLDCEGQLAWTIASLEDFEQYQATAEDVDDVAHGLLSVAGVEVGILLRETESDYRVSVRSRNYASAAEIARSFGGGGHNKAAGCRIPKDPQSILDLIEVASRQLRT